MSGSTSDIGNLLLDLLLDLLIFDVWCLLKAVSIFYLHDNWAARYREWITICSFLKKLVCQKSGLLVYRFKITFEFFMIRKREQNFNKCRAVQPKHLRKSYVEEK